ncbi:hypothetical protein B0H66DRAFT_570021 [Apodospora peruviana]|uniref:Uncharacterized protein n=1 Tax=Apodospora peruviana TaxID=516989 RepID=A0AAE0LYZ4_9PEZI|nr:hypothetical protein B0H66DRAFT_570021 [Apodospora peruviana]
MANSWEGPSCGSTVCYEPDPMRPRMKSRGLQWDDVDAIRENVAKYRFNHWGFVIFRCNYKSQSKWDQFIGLAKQEAQEYFAQHRWGDLSDKLTWTIIEDAITLEGASLATTAQLFVDWVEGPGGQQDREGSIFDTNAYDDFKDTKVYNYGARYNFYLHADEESVESVVDDAKAGRADGYFCTLVRADMALSAEQDRLEGVCYPEEGPEEGEEEDEEERKFEEERELLDVRKRVHIDQLIFMYGHVLDSNRWYNIPVKYGVVEI